MSLQPKDVDRRHFIASGAAVGVAAGLAASQAEAGQESVSWLLRGRQSVVLRDARFVLPPEVQESQLAGMRTLTLSGDPVWFWRSEAAAVLREPSTTLIGVTAWSDLLVFRGLAAESRRRLRYERSVDASGAFVWLIG